MRHAEPPTENRILAALGRALAPLTLSTWGVILLHTWATGRAATLLHPLFQPLLVVTGAALLALALADVLLLEARPARGGWHQWAILLAPALAAALCAPSAYSERMVAARGAQMSAFRLDADTVDREAERLLRQSLAGKPGEPIAVDLASVLSLAQSPEIARKMENRQVLITGQFYAVDALRYRLLRLQMFCCAADATPIGLEIEGAFPEGVANMGWIEVEGSLHFNSESGNLRPILRAVRATPIEPPSDRYLY